MVRDTVSERTFQVGQEIFGRVHNIRDMWLPFDGRAPHAAMPFSGSTLTTYHCPAEGLIGAHMFADDLDCKSIYGLPGGPSRSRAGGDQVAVCLDCLHNPARKLSVLP